MEYLAEPAQALGLVRELGLNSLAEDDAMDTSADGGIDEGALSSSSAAPHLPFVDTIEPIPTKVVQDLDEEDREAFFTRAAQLNMRLVTLLDRLVRYSTSSEKNPKTSSNPQALLKKLAALPSQSRVQQMEDIGLWRDISRFHRRTVSSVEQALSLHITTTEAGAKAESISSQHEAKRAGQQQEEEQDQSLSQSFEEMYMAAVTDMCADDLDKLRKEPSFEGKHVPMLIDFLKAGVDLFGDSDKKLLLHESEE